MTKSQTQPGAQQQAQPGTQPQQEQPGQPAQPTLNDLFSALETKIEDFDRAGGESATRQAAVERLEQQVVQARERVVEAEGVVSSVRSGVLAACDGLIDRLREFRTSLAA